jgi:hypothetical protein
MRHTRAACTCHWPDQTADNGKGVVGRGTVRKKRWSTLLAPAICGRINRLRNSIERMEVSLLRCLAPAISMVKTSQPGLGGHRGRRRRSHFEGPSVGCVLLQRVVDSVLVMVVYVVTQEAEMPFV